MLRVRISFCTLIAILLACSTTLAAPPEGKPVLVPMWKQSTVKFSALGDFSPEQIRSAQEWVAQLYNDAIKWRKNAGRHLISPAVPVGVGDVVVSSNDRSIAASVLRPTKQAETVTLSAGETYWHHDLDRSLIFMGYKADSRSNVERMMNTNPADARNEVLVHNSLSRSFLADQKYARCVDEMSILPSGESKLLRTGHFDFGTERNHVKSVEMDSGRLWVKLPASDEWFADDKRPFQIKFLCPPLASTDLWYYLSEFEKRLHLTCRSWQKLIGRKETYPTRDKNSLLWEAQLVEAKLPLIEDPHRRIHAIHLVENKGLILCPTHLGRVVAVDSKTGKIQWTHVYAPLDAKRFPTFAPEWVVVPPVVVGDKYIYAPADFPELLCLNVADGKKVWSVKKGDGLYPAVIGEQVLVIGEKTLRSLSLKDGSEQWKLDLPGLPCGRGAMLGDKYLLPFSEPKTWKGMIAIVDLKAGKILEVLKPEKDEPIGNLVVHQEFLISQTLTEIAVFPIRK